MLLNPRGMYVLTFFLTVTAALCLSLEDNGHAQHSQHKRDVTSALLAGLEQDGAGRSRSKRINFSTSSTMRALSDMIRSQQREEYLEAMNNIEYLKTIGKRSSSGGEGFYPLGEDGRRSAFFPYSSSSFGESD